MNIETVMQYILHIIASALMVPVMIVLVALVAFTLFCVGWVIIEYITERRHFKAKVPDDVNAIHDASYEKVPDIIAGTDFLVPQKSALEMVANNMGLSDGDLYAVAKAEMELVNDRYSRVVKVTELITKAGPMMGLMCTLIPLGPGIVAMSGGDLDTLSHSLLVAFDGTVAGMLAAVVSMVISTIRKRWYRQYMSALEALMDTLLDKAEDAREAGIALPHNFTVRDLENLRSNGCMPRGKPENPEGQLAAGGGGR